MQDPEQFTDKPNLPLQDPLVAVECLRGPISRALDCTPEEVNLDTIRELTDLDFTTDKTVNDDTLKALQIAVNMQKLDISETAITSA
ncbi:MAG TPA: hypothetical protein VHR86_04980, partial [Armatimonadota bacterium]|nr:hypothetical protein [Armatimonadota bacterium]